jgi:GNAT superfamily N-acetyltransferase
VTVLESRPRRRTLADGSTVTIRPIEAGDAFRLRRMFDRLSPESVYQRFFAPVPLARKAALIHLAGVDHDLHESLVAEAGGEIVAVARYDAAARARGDGGSADRGRSRPNVRGRPADGTAEVAVLVEDAWQGRGLGTLLLFRLARIGADRGLVAFRAVVLGENRAALRFLRRLSPDAEVRVDGGQYVAYAPFGSPAQAPAPAQADG